jgi:hypothetical protein
VFYDEHTTVGTVSDLDKNFATDGGLTSCSAICSQIYNWNGVPVNSFTITRNFTMGIVGPAAVTNVQIEKAPQ